ncbi:MAG: hypothetical protein ABIA04_16185 [Pseudomonadota bacterium]
MKRILSLVLLISLFSFFALSAQEAEYPKVNFGGTLYTDYQFTYNGAAGNDFTLQRMMLKAVGNVSENWKIIALTDVYGTDTVVNETITLSDGTTATTLARSPYTMRMNEASANYTNWGHTFSFGLIKTLWDVPDYSTIWHHRSYTIVPLAQSGYNMNGSWDLGVSVAGKAGNFLKYMAGVFNGESYLNVGEVDNNKNYQGRLHFTFAENFNFITGFEVERATSAADYGILVPVIAYYDMGWLKPAVNFNFKTVDGNNDMMIAVVVNSWFADKKVNPWFGVHYGLASDSGTVTLAENDIKGYLGLGYNFAKHAKVDLVATYTRDDSADSYNFGIGPFLELAF